MAGVTDWGHSPRICRLGKWALYLFAVVVVVVGIFMVRVTFLAKASPSSPAVIDEEKVPADIVNSQIEYALEAATRALTLSPVPVVDSTGRPLTKLEQAVGPLKTVKEWGESVVVPLTVRDYPNADRLVRRWIVPAGRVIR